MIVLDTNVVSEVIRRMPDEAVLQWLDRQQPEDLHLTAVTAAELQAGVALLPSGARRRDLGAKIDRILDEAFAGRILPFDAVAAAEYAPIVASRTRAGRPISRLDAQIAAVCVVHGAMVATRDRGGFTKTGVQTIDPWSG